MLSFDLIFWQQHLIMLYVAVFILGLCIGSFLNVVVHRVPLMLTADNTINLVWPRSFCPQCKKNIAWYDNLPLLSFLILQGKCRHCQSAISLRYPIIEFISALGSCILLFHFGLSGQFSAACILFWFLLAMTAIDLATQLLPDTLTLCLMWLGLLVNIKNLFCPLADAVLGAAIAYSFLWLVAKAYQLYRKQEGIGYGDFKLFAALGAWFGWQSLPTLIFIAAFSGAFVGIILMAFKKANRFTAIPFGPFLALAAMVQLFL